MKARRWNLMKMSAEGAFTEQRLALPATRDSAGCMRPVTRSQTKSRSSLKRKGPSQDTAKTGRPAKLARTASTSSGASTKRNVREPAMGIPTDVPRSMLMSFRVDASPFQLYDGERKMTVDSVSRSSSPPRFPATASQPMFDHSWQVAHAEPSHTADDEQSHQAEVSVPICAPPQHPAYPTAVPYHLRPMLLTPPPSAPSPRDVSLMLPNVRHNREHGDENRSPAGLTTLEEAVSPLKVASLSIDQPVAPLCSSIVSSPNRPSRAVSDEASFSCRQLSPVYAHPVPLAVMSTHSPVSSIAALRSATSSPSIGRDQSERTIVEPIPPSYLPGQTPYATHHILPLHPGYMLFGVPSPVYPSLMPPLSHLPPNGSHPTDPSLSTPNHVPPYLPYSPIHPGAHPGAFVPAHTFDTHTSSSHLQGVPLSVSGHDGMHGQPAFMPHFAPPGTATPWCAMFDSLKGGSKRLGGSSKQKKRTADLPPTSDASCPSAASPSTSTEPTATKGPIAGVHACPMCPRTFSLPNSLAIHLKWHWGASSLDWKRGINMQGKGLQRAFRDAEKRREEVDKLQLQLEQAFAGEPDPATAAEETGEGAAPASEPEFSFDPMYAFDMPVIAQSSLSSIFDFAFSTANASDVFEESAEDQTSARSSQMPHASSSSSASPTLLSSSAAASFSDSSAYHPVPLTPELVSADSRSSNAASVGYGSPTWSYALFGGELDSVDAGTDADVRIDGEFGVDMDDLFGGFDIGDIGGGTDGLNIGDGLGVGEAFNIGERLDVGNGLSTGGDSAAYSSGTHHEAEGLNSVGRRVSDHCGAFVSSASASLRPRTEVPHAPRLGPLRLSLGMVDDEDDVEDLHAEEAFFGQCGGGDVGGVAAALLQCPLAPLDDFDSLQSLPGLDAFDRLSLF